MSDRHKPSALAAAAPPRVTSVRHREDVVVAPRLSLADRIADWRNRMAASPGFQRWAGSFFLTRFIARRHARELFDL